jgi:hypothetical protein
VGKACTCVDRSWSDEGVDLCFGPIERWEVVGVKVHTYLGWVEVCTCIHLHMGVVGGVREGVHLRGGGSVKFFFVTFLSLAVVHYMCKTHIIKIFF